MQVTATSSAPLAGGTSLGTSPSGSANERNAFEAARKLNSLQIAGRQYSVVRDPESQRFVVVVLDDRTGTVLDQFPPEEILRMMAQLSAFNTAKAATPGETLA